jgi:hypothetical protein
MFAGGMSRRQFLKRSSAGVAGVAGVLAVAGVPAVLVSSCGAVGNDGFSDLFGPAVGAVRSLGRSALDADVLADASPAAVVAQLPTAGVVFGVDGARLTMELDDRVAFIDAYEAQSLQDRTAGSLVFVDGYALTVTEAALAAACAQSLA